jgi:hypothetical protein
MPDAESDRRTTGGSEHARNETIEKSIKKGREDHNESTRKAHEFHPPAGIAFPGSRERGIPWC